LRISLKEGIEGEKRPKDKMKTGWMTLEKTCCVSGNNILQRMAKFTKQCSLFVGLAYQGKDVMFRFIIEYSSLRDWPLLGNNNRSILLYEDF
jgi:hypothetical protein